ncbi:hypothetical protein ACVBEF_05825 [Glaciimonas sp. GG7]
MADAGQGTTGSMQILRSEWLGLSPHLIAKIYPVGRHGERTGQEQCEVHAPVTAGGNIEATLNWQSPFEQSSPDSKAPALIAMLQSGALLPGINDLKRMFGFGGTPEQAPQDVSKIEASIKKFEGRTGITKLNSTQIFTGMPPIKINVSLIFRAFSNPKGEVFDPLKKIWEWALPQKLSDDSLVKRLAGTKDEGVISSMFPSTAPQLIGFQYKQRSFAPMVIETIGEPIDAPIDRDGYYTDITIPLTLATLTALDRRDVDKFITLRK